MLDTLSIAIPLVVAAVLISSAIAKFRTPDDLAEWEKLGVPRAFRQDWLRRLHPWGELALGIGIALLGGWLGAVAVGIAIMLMLAYTVLVARVVARADDTSCACFGARKRVTRVTVARNIWLTALAVVGVAVIWTTPLFGGALAASIPQFSWLVALAVAAVTTALVLWPEAGTAETGVAPAPADGLLGQPAGAGDDFDYIRARTPAVPVTLADGSIRNLRMLAAEKPILLLAVSVSCGSCDAVYEQRNAWRGLIPEVDVRLLMRQSPQDSRWTELEEPQSLHDVEDYVAGSIAEWGTPTAVLLGADGLLAGGPISGSEAIGEFVGDIYESLHGERFPRGKEPVGLESPVHGTSA